MAHGALERPAGVQCAAGDQPVLRFVGRKARLAPENAFPAARDDVVRAYDYLLQQGYEAKNIVLCGDSCGGGLVIQAVLAIRDAGKATPAGAVAVSAWIDLANEGETRVSNPPEALALLEDLKAKAALYLGSTDSRDPRANPLYADLTGLPPSD